MAYKRTEAFYGLPPKVQGQAVWKNICLSFYPYLRVCVYVHYVCMTTDIEISIQYMGLKGIDRQTDRQTGIILRQLTHTTGSQLYIVVKRVLSLQNWYAVLVSNL